MAKKVLPIHLETREREILRRLSVRDNISMAEVVRRSIRNLALDVIDPKALERPSNGGTGTGSNTASAR